MIFFNIYDAVFKKLIMIVRGLDHDRIFSNFTQIKFFNISITWNLINYALYNSVVNIFNLSYFNEKLFCTYRTLRNKIVTIRSPRKWRIQRYLDQTWAIKSKTIMAIFTKQKMSFYFFFIPSITLSNRAWGHNLVQTQGGNWSAYI